MTNFQEGKPSNYENLKNSAKNEISWRERLEAVEQLGKWKCKESIDILWRRMMSDEVYTVQESAFRKLQAFGEGVRLPKKKKGNLIKGINEKLGKVKNLLPEEHTFSDFKVELQKKQPKIYDTYEGDKQDRFENWLENTWRSLPKKK